MKSYEETVKELLELPKFTSKNTLDHTREFLRRLGNPQNRFQIIHVAGSNGKGSVCAFLASVLKAAGKKTGLFTSPHLVEIEERFQIDGTPCRKQEIVQAAEQAEAAASMMVQEGLPHPTFFEYVFAVGMVIFAEHEIEYAVLETGMGGRLDATNIVAHPLLTVITSISLEHTEILGDTLEKIAAEKAGILKPGVPVVYDASVPKAVSVIEKRADFLHCPRHPVRPEKIKILLNTGKKIDFSYDSGYDVTELRIPFVAPYQAQNAAVALQSLKCIAKQEGISDKDIRCGFAQVRWKGRMEQARPEVYFDGAHNSDGIERFLDAAEQITNRPGILLFSMVKEKNYAYAAERLLARGDWEEIILTKVAGARGIDSEELRELFEQAVKKHGQTVIITTIEEVDRAYQYALSVKKPGQVLFCAGSLYLIGELERIAGGM